MADLTGDHVHAAECSADEKHFVLEILNVNETEVAAETRGASDVDGQASEGISHYNTKAKSLVSGRLLEQVSGRLLTRHDFPGALEAFEPCDQFVYQLLVHLLTRVDDRSSVDGQQSLTTHMMQFMGTVN